MEIGLAGELIIKCLHCGAEYRIDIDSLDEETFAYERSMGDEVEHDFYGECQCEDCGNVMRFTIKAFEYPVGALNYCDINQHVSSHVECVVLLSKVQK